MTLHLRFEYPIIVPSVVPGSLAGFCCTLFDAEEREKEDDDDEETTRVTPILSTTVLSVITLPVGYIMPCVMRRKTLVACLCLLDIRNFEVKC